jgi:hypothetical protein
MHDLSLEGLQTGYLGPSNIIQVTTSRKQNISIILNDLSCLGILHCDVPDTYQPSPLNLPVKFLPFLRRIVPFTARNLMRQLHISHHPIFIRHALQIRIYLLRRRIERRPIWVGIEGVLVAMRRNIAGAAYISYISPKSNYEQKESVPGYLFSHHVPPTPSFFS